MGRRKWNAPRRGSLAFSPRKKARRWIGRVQYWPQVDGAPRPLAFIGYKAGMTHVIATDNRKGSITFGKEIAVPVTVIQTPPMLIFGIRAYVKTDRGIKSSSEVWMQNPPKEITRLITPPKKYSLDGMMKKFEGALDTFNHINLLLTTQPRLAGKGAKTPQIFEARLSGGDLKEQFKYAQEKLGKEIKAPEIFQEGQMVDVIAVSKGKGFQGPVKRFGVAKLPHKSRKRVRGVGTLGPWHPHFVMRTVPRAGQMGFHQRTEYNKQILKIGSDGAEVNPKGGFVKYGLITSDYIMLKGSIVGATKRLITLRYALRSPATSEASLKVEEVNLDSKQGN